MTRPLHNGRAGTEVIPSTWPTDHRPAVEGTMKALCEIREPDVIGPFDRDLGKSPILPGALLYSGKCRVVRTNTDRVQPVASQQIQTLDYLVTIPMTSGIQPDCVVSFTLADDEDLLTSKLTVQGVLKGSHVWERDLFCIDNLARKAEVA